MGRRVGREREPDVWRPAVEPQAQRAPARAPASAADQSWSSGYAGVVQLQRTAGNRAVGHWLGRRRLTVQCFSGHEHESLGNVTGASVDLGHGVVLTWGQVVAIAGDEFGTVEELQTAAATEEGRRRIRAALEHDEVRGPIPASLPAATGDDKTAQEGAYLDLLLGNVTHFSEGGSARVTWRDHHDRALRKAFTAGMSRDDTAFQQAQALEAFGQHFLTDMFSGGHVRTPRQEVMDYYADRAQGMATAFITNFRQRFEDVLVSQVMQQLYQRRLAGSYTQDKAREKIHESVGKILDEKLAPIGGMAGVPQWFGKAIAGAVSGAMHDRDGRRGVVVRSEAHPMPWLAKGDSQLDQSPESRDQAELAILAAREQLLAARLAGERQPVIDRLVPVDPPSVVHFGFDSSSLQGARAAPGARDAVAAAGAWLNAHPNDVVDVVGHTDPLGTDDYNLGLGRRRAEVVKAALIEGGARPDQVVATSQGEASLRTTDPRQYRENRRVELIWQCRAVPAPNPLQGQGAAQSRPDDPTQAKVQQALARFGPPYAEVERYVPEAVPDMNEPLPEWRWGQMSPELVTELDNWIRNYVGPKVDGFLKKIPETQTETATGGITLTVTPRQAAAGIVAEIMRQPSRTLGDLMGQQPGRP